MIYRGWVGAFRRRARHAPPVAVPEAAQTVLALIPVRFVDDGCSAILDGLAGVSWRWACRIHDWRACSRCHLREYMHPAARARADAELRRNILASIPIGWVAIPALVWAGLTFIAGRGYYDTCGPFPDGATEAQRRTGLCRHGMLLPEWWGRP